jgi:hypothetical protein
MLDSGQIGGCGAGIYLINSGRRPNPLLQASVSARDCSCAEALTSLHAGTGVKPRYPRGHCREHSGIPNPRLQHGRSAAATYFVAVFNSETPVRITNDRAVLGGH